MGTWKEDSLNHKYAEVPEEPRYKKKKKNARPKKADHRHEYRNCKIVYKLPDNWYVREDKDRWTSKIVSYCPICGKIGAPQRDDELNELCPHVYISPFFWMNRLTSEEEKKIFDKYVEKHYPIFVVENYMNDFSKGQIFLDREQLDSVR